MNYQRYKNARNMAWQILLDESICSLPVNVGRLCRSLEISVRQYAGEDDSDGRSLIVEGRPLILVSRNKPIPRQRFTAAHELGHVLLGHVEEGGLRMNREPAPGDNPLEREANVFASRLLAPACVLWGCGVRSPEDIAELCGISRQSAEFRWQRIEVLLERDRFLSSPIERKVYEQFADYIASHKL